MRLKQSQRESSWAQKDLLVRLLSNTLSPAMAVLPLFSRDLAAGEAWKLEFGPTVRRVSGEVRQELLRSARVPALSWPEGGSLS